MELELGFFAEHLKDTLPMAGLGMVGIFVVVLVMMASIYGVTILSTKISQKGKK